MGPMSTHSIEFTGNQSEISIGTDEVGIRIVGPDWLGEELRKKQIIPAEDLSFTLSMGDEVLLTTKKEDDEVRSV